MKTHTRFFTVLIILSALLTACNPISQLQSRSRLTLFDDAFQLYSKHLRWGHYRQITSQMTQEHIPLSIARITALKNRRISQIEAPLWNLNESQDSTTGTVVISYYLADQGIVRQSTQQQTWIFQDDRWLLDAPLPDLP